MNRQSSAGDVYSAPAFTSRQQLVAALVVVTLVLAAGVSYAMRGSWLDPSGVQASPICDPYRPLTPVGDGVVRTVNSEAELAAAMAAAKPGDTINLQSGTYRQLEFRDSSGHANGSFDAPIVIQAAAGAHPVIDYGNPYDPVLKPAVYITNRSHVTVRGLEIRNRTFGVMSANSHHVTIEYNDVHTVGYAGIVARGFYADPNNTFSSHVTIRCNRVHNTGLDVDEYGEGIYVGTGATGLTDKTNHVVVERNEIFDGSNEGVDVKRNTTNVTVRGNWIHDVTPKYGGAISVGLNKNNYPSGEYLVENNRIWNITTEEYYAQAIAVAHGNTVVRNNVIWDVDTSPQPGRNGTSEIQIHGSDNPADWAYGFGNPSAATVTITGNTVLGCEESCIDSYTAKGMIRPTVRVADNIVENASSGGAVSASDVLVNASMLVGPTSGRADAGSGPGSGLALAATNDVAAAESTTTTTAKASTTTTSADPSTTTTADSTTATAAESPTSTTVEPTTTSAAESTTTTTAQPRTTTTTEPTTTELTTADSTTTTTDEPATTTTTDEPATAASADRTTTTEASGTDSATPKILALVDRETVTASPATTTPQPSVPVARPESAAGDVHEERGRGWKRFGRGSKSQHWKQLRSAEQD